ncbi:DUF305 domain-containing protein [Planomonospora parontospora subsp. antibiotica]|nr:DUF305 domain-containing protein [Planomonospora parontospora subsp. antibiotica]GII13373.1 DUF305 domain-containing protein [Planomonospora parontospora subsp. antibiotica]
MESPAEESSKSRRRPILVLILGCLAVVAVTTLVMGRSAEPTDASAEAGFARDMAAHHAQAVEMSFIARDGTEDESVRGLAYDIIITQTAQRGMFMGWLQQWELGQATERPSMAWMAGHGHGGTAGAPAAMPGMASAAELDRLRKATGREQEILFLQLMIRHHEGGVQMAEALLKLSDRDEVVTMARHIVNTQDGEIKLMKDMLKQRGAQPLPSIRQ